MATQLPVSTDELITIDQFTKVLPKGIGQKLTVGMVNTINGVLTDPGIRDNFRDNLLGFASIMQDGKYKLQSYIDAVKYVSYKLLGSTNIEAYVKTHPTRYQRLIGDKVDNKVISSYVAAYNKTKLVQKIFEQTLVATHVFNADIHQKAVNHLANLMITANSEKVQADAANSLLQHLKAPEVIKLDVAVGVKQDKSIDMLREATLALAAQQRDLIKAGVMNTKEVAHSNIIDVKAEDITDVG